MGYVYFSPDKSYYSVPYRYISKNTQIQYTRSTVEVYYNHERIALHKRNPAKGIYITNKTHLSSSHQAYSDWSPDYFKQKATKHGNHVLAFIEGVLSQGNYPETAYKRSMGIIQLHRTYGSERLNNVCKIAMEAGTFSYNRLKNMLKNNIDMMEHDIEQTKLFKSHIPNHNNLRGATNYH